MQERETYACFICENFRKGGFIGVEIRILYAEDDLGHLFLTQRMLSNLGVPHHIHHFINGKALLDYLHISCKEGQGLFKNTIILLDLKMPVMGGIETLEEIKKHPELSRIPVFIYTTSDNGADASKCYKMGCDGYFVKSFQPDAVKEMAKELNEKFLVQWSA